MLDDFGHAADICGDYGDFAAMAARRRGRRIRAEREAEKDRSGEFFVDVVLFAEEENVLLKFFLADEVFGGAASGPSQ